MKRNREIEVGEISQYFPHFIWLLRDVSLITSDDGEGGEMDPTDYIKKKVFNSFSGLIFHQQDTVVHILNIHGIVGFLFYRLGHDDSLETSKLRQAYVKPDY